MKKNILAICSLILAFPLVGQAMQPAISVEKHQRTILPRIVLKFSPSPVPTEQENIPPVVPEVLYTLLRPWQTTVRKGHFAGLSARKVPAPLSLRLAELLNYKKH